MRGSYVDARSLIAPSSAAEATRRGLLLLFFALAMLAVLPAAAQDDVNTTTTAGEGYEKDPRGALWRAAAVPGWGQYYNRQYYKIPFVWAGLGGLVGAAVHLNQRYLLNRHALHFVTHLDPETEEPLLPRYRDDFLALLNEPQFAGLTEEQAWERRDDLARYFESRRDNLRRNRDLLYIGIGLFYSLTVLDAYVNAHLLNFDIGEDLTVSVRPVPAGFSATVLM